MNKTFTAADEAPRWASDTAAQKTRALQAKAPGQRLCVGQ